MKRYEIRHGSYGSYFYDSKEDYDLTLKDVEYALNNNAPRLKKQEQENKTLKQNNKKLKDHEVTKFDLDVHILRSVMLERKVKRLEAVVEIAEWINSHHRYGRIVLGDKKEELSKALDELKGKDPV